MVLKRVDVNGYEFLELITEAGVSHICTMAHVGKNEYCVYGDKGEGFCIATLNSEKLLELITTNEVNIYGDILKPYDGKNEESESEIIEDEPLHIVFACDAWRSYSSFQLIGAFNKKGLKEYFESDYKNYKYNGKEITTEDLAAIQIEDLLEQRVDYLHVISSKINEVLI